MSNVDKEVEELIRAIKESESYRNYEEQLKRVKEVPGLKEQIDDYRTKNFELQTGGENAFDKLEQFEREYADFRENPLVNDFLASELDFCRMMQEINIHITESLDFE